MDQCKTIFITGLHRSGTTLLDMIIGNHSDCIAVGEVSSVIKSELDRKWVENHYNKCTCGECEFWPEVMKAIDKNGSAHLEDRYRVFLEIFRDFFPGKIPVDSSKHLNSYKILNSISDCTTVRIIRDVRGWCLSNNSRITPRFMLRWYKNNYIIERTIPDAIPLGYEQLALDTETTIRNLCDSISLKYEKSMLNIQSGEKHILVGNRMKANSTLKIKYDSRWLKNSSIWPVILKPVMNYNRKHVYGT